MGDAAPRIDWRHVASTALGVLGGTVGAVAAVAVVGAAFALTFDSGRSVGMAAGIADHWAWSLPVTVDAAIAVATVAAIVLRLRGCRDVPARVVAFAGCSVLIAFGIVQVDVRDGDLRLNPVVATIGWALSVLAFAMAVHMFIGAMIQVRPGKTCSSLQALLHARRVYTAVVLFSVSFGAIFLMVRAWPLVAYFALQGAIAMCGRSNADGYADGHTDARQEAAKEKAAAAAEATQRLEIEAEVRRQLAAKWAEADAARLKAEARIAHELAARTPCEIVIDCPEAPPGHGYLYVIKFSSGVVKVGQTRDPRRRLGEHRRDAEAYDVAITSYWLSPAHKDYLDNEVRLINICSRLGERAKREYFHGFDFDHAVRLAAGLTGQDGSIDEKVTTL